MRLSLVVMLGVVFVATCAGTVAFQAFATRKGIVANPNFRSLHQRPMPRAGGIMFSLVFIAAAAAFWLTTPVEAALMRALVLGGTVAALFGFADDVLNLGVGTKLLAQALLAAWPLISFGGIPLVDLPWLPTAVDLAVSWLALVWLMNLYNFMDGIDGMAASGAVFISAAAIVALLLTSGYSTFVLLLAVLATCTFAFLLFNWPPASIFMGDAGSLFLGYCFGALIVGTTVTGMLSIWTWLVIFGYFAGDTTTTTVLRVFLTEQWYGEHRSHAYQNLARILNSHVTVVRGVSLYHVLWLLPLTIWSVRMPSYAPLAAALALVPVMLWTLRNGPRLSSS